MTGPTPRLLIIVPAFNEAEQLDIALRRMTIGRDGRVYIAPDREAYRIDVFAPGGGLDRVIEREYAEHRRTEVLLDILRRTDRVVEVVHEEDRTDAEGHPHHRADDQW